MKQQFAFNDGTRPELEVIQQRSRSYDSLAIQISAVFDLEDVEFNVWDTGRSTATVGVKWVYEEIDIATDAVVYARFMSEELIKANYPWAYAPGEEAEA